MENMQTLNIEIQDHTGDRKLTLDWKPGDKVAESHFQKMFEDLQRAGYRFYSVKRVMGIFKKKDKEVNYYDPSLGELIYEQPKNQNKVNVTSNEQMENPIKELEEARKQLDETRKDLKSIKEENEKMKGSLKIYESEKTQKLKYEDQKKFNPEKESVDTSRDYVATKKMRAG